MKHDEKDGGSAVLFCCILLRITAIFPSFLLFRKEYDRINKKDNEVSYEYHTAC